MRVWGSLSAILGFGLAAGVAMAGDCGFEQCWGAVSIGPQGEWAWSTGYAAESGAVAKIQNQCKGCSEIETFYNGCAVMARTPSGAWSFGWGDTRSAAQRAALGYCARFGQDCAPAVWACSY